MCHRSNIMSVELVISFPQFPAGTLRQDDFISMWVQSCADPKGGGAGGPDPPPPPQKNHKNIGFLSNTGLDPLKITKLPSQHSMLRHHRHPSETPFNYDGVSLVGQSWPAYSGIWILPFLINYCTTPDKTLDPRMSALKPSRSTTCASFNPYLFVY